MLTVTDKPNRYAKPCLVGKHLVAPGEGWLVPRPSGEGFDVVCREHATVITQRERSRQGAVATAPVVPLAPPVVQPPVSQETFAPPFRRGVQGHLDVPTEHPGQTTAKPHHIAVQAATGQSYRGVAPGIYTMEFPDGHYRTFRVRVQESDADFAPGKAVLEYLRGPSNETDYQAFAFIDPGFRLKVWKRFRETALSDLLDDAEQFARHPEHAHLAATCIRCNALLTTPESIAAGIGPTCANRGW